MATATPIDNAERPWSITRTVNSTVGQRWYKVDSADPGAVMSATGLPFIGQSWDATTYKNLIVSEVGPQDTWSHVQGEADRAGWSYVPVGYRTLDDTTGFSDPDPPAGTSVKHTVYNRSTQSVTVRRGLVFLQGSDPPGLVIPSSGQTGTIVADVTAGLLIDNGNGAPKEVNTITAQVHGFRTLENPYDEAALEDLCTDPAVNSDTVILPPVYGTTNARTFAPGKLRFAGYDIEKQQGFWHLRVTLEIRFNHYYYWSNVNKDGEAAANQTIYASKIYRTAPLTPALP